MVIVASEEGISAIESDGSVEKRKGGRGGHRSKDMPANIRTYLFYMSQARIYIHLNYDFKEFLYLQL
jgi:hypothetical protein